MAITVVLVAFAMTGGVYADMALIASPDAVCSPATCTCHAADAQTRNWPDWTAHPAISDPGFLAVASLAQQPIDADSTQLSVQVLTTDRSSLDLCLYAMIGLGLCRSGHWAKKSALGLVPPWYHTGGPYQIGHSHAIDADTLCPVSVCCFIQPDDTAASPLTPCRTGPTATLRRQSQHTPTALAPRGPPLS